MRMDKPCLSLCLLVLLLAMAEGAPVAPGAGDLKSNLLCTQCTKCDANRCPPSEAFPHMTAFDDTLISSALQSDFVHLNDRGVYSVPGIKGGESKEHNAYYGWNISSGSVSGYHRFSNYMDKCTRGPSYLTADKSDKVSIGSLSSQQSLSAAEWKSINPPKGLNHRGFRFWQSRSSGKCLTVFKGKTQKRRVGTAECKFDGSDPFKLFAFRFHYHKAFCCCGLHNN